MMKISYFALSGALLMLPLVGCTSSSTSENAAPADNSSATGNTMSGNTMSGNATSGNTMSGNSAGGTASGGKTLKLAFVTNNVSDFWTVARKGVEKADGELKNVSVEFKLPDKGTSAEQKQIIDDLLSNGVDGLAISPSDPANQTDYLNQTAKKVLVFTQDSDAPKSNRACYIGTDNVAAGRQAGEQLKKTLPNGGKIMVFVGQIDAQNAADRYKGIKDVIAGSKIQVIDVITDAADHTKAKSNVADALVKYPDLAACVGLWSYNGPAILGAIKDAGKVGKVKIVCFDSEADTLTGIKSGAIAGTVVQQPFEFGYQAVMNMNKVLNGDKSVIPASKQIFVPTKIITKADVDAFKAEQDKMTAG